MFIASRCTELQLGFSNLNFQSRSAFLNGQAILLRHFTSTTSISSKTCRRSYRATPNMAVKEKNNDRLIALAQGRGVDKTVASRVIEAAQRTVRDWSMGVTDFLTPPESATMSWILSNLNDIQVKPWGGYDDAERTILALAHSEICDDSETLPTLVADQLALLRINGDFSHQSASHRDFMGAVLNAGVSRTKIGDIIVLDTRGAQAIVNADIIDFLCESITSVRQVKVQTERLSLDQIEIPPKQVKEIQSVEASLRLDAVVSAGFKISRSKLADMARSGLVQLNYKEVKGPAKNVKTGDIVSVRGVGKLEISGYTVTSKGKYRVEMRKYI